MAELTNTDLNSSIPELWDEEVLEGRYAGAVIMNRVNNKTGLVAKQGDSLHITVDAKYSAGTLGANSSFVPQTIQPSSINLVINTNVQVAVEVVEQAIAQSFYNPLSTFAKNAGKAMAVKYDQDLAAQITNLNLTAVGTDSAPIIFGSDAMLTAIKRIAEANVPTDDGMLSFILPPAAFYDGLLREQQLTAANMAGVPKNVLTTNYQFSLRGIPFYISNLLSATGSATGVKGALLHKTALAIGMQRQNIIREADRTASLIMSTVKVCFSLFGVQTVRADHGVICNVKTT